MQKKVIIFDMDGVIFDSIEMSYQQMLLTYPELTRDEHKHLSSGNFHDELEKYKASHPSIKRNEEEQALHRTRYMALKLQSPLFPGIEKLLRDLHQQGHILVLNTSALERNSFPLLEKANLKHVFDFLATMDVSKSKVEKFAMIDKMYNASKKDTLFITDSLGDIREADIGGIPTIAVTWGIHDRAYFQREVHNNVLAIVDSTEELEQFIKNY